MKHFNLPVSFNYKIFRTMGLFIALFLLSILIRIPATSEIDITRFYSIVIPSILSFLIISYFEKLTCNFFINYFFLLALYLSIPYLKLLDHYVLLPSEIISAFGAGTLLFSVVTYFYLLYSLTPPYLKNFSFFLYILLLVFTISIPMFILGYYYLSGHLLTPDIILTIFQTNINEASSYMLESGITSWFIILLLFAGTIIISMYLQQKFFYPSTFSKGIAIGGFFLFVISCYLPTRLDAFYPINLISSSIEVLDSFNDYSQMRAMRQQHLKSLTNLQIMKNAGGIHLLIIGESATRDHMHAYGYSRKTTPFLDMLSNNPYAIFFSNAYSNHTHTVPSLTYALTEKNQYNNIPLGDALSIVEVAKAAGYNIYWISNQQKYGAFDTPIAEIASIADHEIWLNKNVGAQVATGQYDANIAQTLASLSPNSNSLIIIHLIGSHFGYSDRYPKSFDYFSGETRSIDTYDNSILYTDSVLQQIFKIASTYPSLSSIVYLSDHGEDTVSKGGHESTKFTWPMSHIPLIMYFSPQFSQNRSYVFNTLMNNKDKYWTNDLLYNVMISILGIQGMTSINDKWDIASPQYNMSPDTLYTLHGQRKLSEDK